MEEKFLSSNEIERIESENNKKEDDNEKADKEIMANLEKLLELKQEAANLEDKRDEEGLKEVNYRIFNLNTKIAKIYDEDSKHLYTFDEIGLKIEIIKKLRKKDDEKKREEGNLAKLN